MFVYSKINYYSRLVFYLSYAGIGITDFKECDWKYVYKGAKEAIPGSAPKSRGKYIDVRCFVYADHAGDTVFRSSRTGFFIYTNMAPIVLYSNRFLPASKYNPAVAGTFAFYLFD